MNRMRVALLTLGSAGILAGGGAAIANAASSNGTATTPSTTTPSTTTPGLANDTVARQREPELPGNVARQMRAAPALLRCRTRAGF